MTKAAENRFLQKVKNFLMQFLKKKRDFPFYGETIKYKRIWRWYALISIREQTEADQDMILSPFATRATQSKGRRRPEAPCQMCIRDR